MEKKTLHQEKQVDAYARRVQKKYQIVKYTAGDEVLLNMKKHGRKGGRLESNVSGPYTIQHIHIQTSSITKLRRDHFKNYVLCRKPISQSASEEPHILKDVSLQAYTS